MKHKKTVAYIFQWKTLVTWQKTDMDFSYFLGVFHRFSINIRIEIHLFLFALGNERTLVACKSLRSASRFTRFTRDQYPFISQCKQKSVLQSLTKAVFWILPPLTPLPGHRQPLVLVPDPGFQKRGRIFFFRFFFAFEKGGVTKILQGLILTV